MEKNQDIVPTLVNGHIIFNQLVVLTEDFKRGTQSGTQIWTDWSTYFDMNGLPVEERRSVVKFLLHLCIDAKNIKETCQFDSNVKT